jgi:hypothetical protein
MPDNADEAPPVSQEMPPFAASASDHAPFLYFEHAPNFGHLNGVIQITLEAQRFTTQSANNIVRERVVVAHLRMSLPSAMSFKAAIEGALLLANPASSESMN